MMEADKEGMLESNYGEGKERKIREEEVLGAMGKAGAEIILCRKASG